MEFKARITPAEVRAKIAEEAKARLNDTIEANSKKKLGEKEIPPKHLKRKPEIENLAAAGAGAEDKKPETKKPETEEKKAKPKETKKPAPQEFPATIRINAYGFIGIRKPLLAALGWKKDLTLKLERNADGSVTVRKA